MAELKVYEVEINGWPTTVQLTDEDAKERGLTQTKAKTAVSNKSRTPANKAD